MDFLDTAIGKAKETWDIVSKKTEEVVTTQSRKLNIALLENQCSKFYENLGKIVYEKYQDAIDDEEIKNLISLIDKKQSEISEIKAELDIK